MNYKIIPTSRFSRELKRLAKKLPSLKKEYASLLDELETNPTASKSIGHNCYKIRISISSKGKGKRGGGRVITYVKVISEIVYLLTIYDKSERGDIPDRELKTIIENLI
jgi:mRNA-degrading endonuclease RelE of RelBE toxin-antitoxin system